MRDRRSYIFGFITIGAVLGFAAYSIYEYKKLSKQQEGEITLDQAKKEIEDSRTQEITERYESGEIEGFREEMVEMGPEEYENPREFTEEDEELRHDPNSAEAREQFIAMNLAEWDPGSKEYETLLYLYTFPFVPQTDGDRILRDNLIEERIMFFGEDSIWIERVTYADLVLYYAREAEFNLGRSVTVWVRIFLENIEITHLMSSERSGLILEELNQHTYWNSEGLFGLFGLDDDALTDAYEVADLQVNKQVTYEILFNEFMKRIR